MSIIKSIKQVLGLSGTAAENHFWDGSVPNQLSLKRGTPDAPGATVISVVNGEVKTTGGTTSPAAGQVGEILTNSAGAIAMTGSGTFQDLLSLTITPGVWDVQGQVSYSVATGPSVMRSAGLSLTSGAFSLMTSANASQQSVGYFDHVCVPTTRVVATVNTTILLVGRVVFSAGSQSAETRAIQARRVA